MWGGEKDLMREPYKKHLKIVNLDISKSEICFLCTHLCSEPLSIRSDISEDEKAYICIIGSPRCAATISPL